MPFRFMARHPDAVDVPGDEWKWPELHYDEEAHHVWRPSEASVLFCRL